MAEDKVQLTRLAQDAGPRCPSCSAPVRRLAAILDVKKDKLLDVFRCDTWRREIWGDEAASSSAETDHLCAPNDAPEAEPQNFKTVRRPSTDASLRWTPRMALNGSVAPPPGWRTNWKLGCTVMPERTSY
jgi:hypothetical protein